MYGKLDWWARKGKPAKADAIQVTDKTGYAFHITKFPFIAL